MNGGNSGEAGPPMVECTAEIVVSAGDRDSDWRVELWQWRGAFLERERDGWLTAKCEREDGHDGPHEMYVDLERHQELSLDGTHSIEVDTGQIYVEWDPGTSREQLRWRKHPAICDQQFDGWLCSRPADHGGRHAFTVRSA